MVAVHIVAAAAQKEVARQAILKHLREADATNAAMPASIEIDSDDAEAALAELLAAGTVREARSGLYFVDEVKKVAGPGNGFVALLAILVIISFTASLVALVVNAG